MLINNYIKDKLSLKLDVSDTLLNSILRDFTGYGQYEILYTTGTSNLHTLPIGLGRISDIFIYVKERDGYVFLNKNGTFNRYLFPHQFIEFDISEHRNKILTDILE